MPTIIAAVAREQSKPLTPEQLQLDDLRPGGARVRMVATGICHTDAIVRDGVYPTPPARRARARGSRHLRSGRRGRDRGPAGRSCRALGHLLRRMPGRALAYCENLFAQDFGGRRPDGPTALLRMRVK